MQLEDENTSKTYDEADMKVRPCQAALPVVPNYLAHDFGLGFRDHARELEVLIRAKNGLDFSICFRWLRSTLMHSG